MAKIPAKEANLLDLPVSFGSVSFGKKTASVGVSVDREHLKIPVADRTFCDRRLTVTIFANGKNDQQDQKLLAGMEDDIELIGVADVKGFGVHSTNIGFGLTFNINELNKTLAKNGVRFSDFAAREGRLMIAEVGEIPEADKEEETEPEEGSEE